MLVFEERGKPEYPEKNLSEQGREPTQLNPHMTPGPGIEPGHIGGRRALSPPRHPCSLHTILHLHVHTMFKTQIISDF